MKTQRHNKILELILNKSIGTQEEMLLELEKQGFHVTQATVSRDIRELKLAKEMNSNGNYCYVTGVKKALDIVKGKKDSVFYEAITGVDYAGNTVVIKCRAGMANAVCATLDDISWDGVIGTLAGDDTIFVLLKKAEDASAFTCEIYNLFKMSSPS